MGPAEIRILAVGDVVGRPGRRAVSAHLPRLKESGAVDFAVVNAENVAGGAGLTPETANELLASGADVLTSGDHVFKLAAVMPLFEEEALPVLRPANWSSHAPGRGWGVFPVSGPPGAGEVRVGVLNLIGRTFMRVSPDNPFDCAEEVLSRLSAETPIIVVDLHAEATSEKIAFGRYLDGRVSLLFGTHTHVQTADERILPGGTAYITDIGMTGPEDSILGRRADRVIQRLKSGVPAKFNVPGGRAVLCGVLVRIDTESGKAKSISRVVLPEPDEENSPQSPT